MKKMKFNQGKPEAAKGGLNLGREKGHITYLSWLLA